MSVSIRQYENFYGGRPIAVLGGGPSLPADLAHVPAHGVTIAVNHHALLLMETDFMVFCDDPANIPALQAAIRNFSGLRISPQEAWSDFILDARWWDGGFSSALAVWAACWFGGDPVLLCGMDCYQGSVKYFYDRYLEEPGSRHPAHEFGLEANLAAWRPAFHCCPRPERITALSGPLREIFAQ